MYDTTIATKLLKQLEAFLGRISPHFHKPTARFIGDMIYGIMVEKNIKLASIVRALKEKITTLPFIYRGEVISARQKMGNLQNRFFADTG